MFRALYTAASGMQAQQTNLDTIANNLSNSSTAGFQSRRMQFQDLIYQNMIMPGSAASQQTTVAAGLQVGLGTRSSASEIMQTQGELSATGNPLDLAIEGQGLFQVLLPTGQTAYTRSGAFHQDAQGNVVTANGNPLQPAITIPAGATSITIASDGTVSVTLAGQTAAQNVGTVQLALFPNPGGLNSVGTNLYLATTASGDAAIGTPGGSVVGLIQIRDQEIPALGSDLDQLAAGLANGLNTANAAGFDLNGNAGTNLFVPPPVGGVGAAASLAVAFTDPSLLAASSDGTSGSNGNLAVLSAVGTPPLANGETPINSYSSIVFQVGDATSNTSADADSSGLILQQLQDQRGSVSGVSLDEEASNLIQYQTAYQAAARVVSTVNALLSDAVNLGLGAAVQ